jgi:hypothetical protein
MNREPSGTIGKLHRRRGRRLELRQENGEVTRDRYVVCWRPSAESLRKDGLLPARTVVDYIAWVTYPELKPKEITESGGR